MAAAGLVYVAIALLLLLALGGLLAIVLYMTAKLTGTRGNRARHASVYVAGEEALVAACAAALRCSGVASVRRGGPGIVFVGRTRPSLWSSGEELTVRVASAGHTGAKQVEVQSQSLMPGTTVDWGRNRRNVTTFHAHLACLLQGVPGG